MHFCAGHVRYARSAGLSHCERENDAGQDGRQACDKQLATMSTTFSGSLMTQNVVDIILDLASSMLKIR